MPTLSAENAFKKGLSALVDQRPKDASEQFRKALDLQKQQGGRRLDMRYLSYYGLSLARAGLSKRIALQACRTAVTKNRPTRSCTSTWVASISSAASWRRPSRRSRTGSPSRPTASP